MWKWSEKYKKWGKRQENEGEERECESQEKCEKWGKMYSETKC